MRDNDDVSSCNGSGNRPFDDILRARLSRRTALTGGLAAASMAFLNRSGALATQAASGKPLIGFKPVALEDGRGPVPAISEEYEYQVLIPWGTPLQPGGPTFRHPPNAADQAQQIGIGHDGMAYFPLPVRGSGNSNQGMLAINHEFGTNRHVLGKTWPECVDDVRVSQHAHGVSVIEIREVDGRWETVRSERARRIHANTPVVFSGPVAGHSLLHNAAANAPAGTVANCANGRTPWGTYLTCEENFHGYFAASNSWSATPDQARYGFTRDGFRYGWHRFDPRFDLSNADYANEGNRFGWVVEIDPMDASQTPVKRTALGRFRHEGAAVVEGKDRRIVVYMGDDERFNYIYKFVSEGDWRAMQRAGKHPLDHGTLYAATYLDDGSGEWRALSVDDPKIAARLPGQASVLTYARIAADITGATPMDRPEWTTVAPNGDVYCSLTNNSKRKKPGPANPMAPNADGHIVRWRDTDDHVGLTFRWDVFLLARDTHGTDGSFSDPDSLWADPDGRLFIATDGKQQDGLNNQILVADTRTGEIRRLFTGVPDDEVTGFTTTPDRRTLFCNTQHPGKGNPSVTNFPAAQDGVTVPRDCTFAIRRKDGGIVGS